MNQILQILMKNQLTWSYSHLFSTSVLSFWRDRQAVFSNLTPIMQDIMAAPASQTYVHCTMIFSVCGLLTDANKNRTSKSLEMRVCLKLNRNVLLQSGFSDYKAFWLQTTK